MDAGEMAFLTGHSGAGKSTLLKLLMLIERPTSGNLLINGKNINRLPHSKVPFYRRQVGVVFQNHQLLFDRSVFENVALPLQVAGYSQARYRPPSPCGPRYSGGYSTERSIIRLPYLGVNSSGWV